MPTITSKHRHFELAIRRLLQRYEEALSQYDDFMENMSSSVSPTENQSQNVDISMELIRVSEEVTSSKYALILVVSSHVEAIVNFYLSQLLTAEQFEAVEYCKTTDKWIGIIEMVTPEYEIKAGTELYDLLVTLTSTRNALVHHKPKFRDEGKDVHKGSDLKHLDENQKDRDRIRKWSMLPDLLIENLLKYDRSHQAIVTKLFSKAAYKKNE